MVGVFPSFKNVHFRGVILIYCSVVFFTQYMYLGRKTQQHVSLSRSTNMTTPSPSEKSRHYISVLNHFIRGFLLAVCDIASWEVRLFVKSSYNSVLCCIFVYSWYFYGLFHIKQSYWLNVSLWILFMCMWLIPQIMKYGTALLNPTVLQTQIFTWPCF